MCILQKMLVTSCHVCVIMLPENEKKDCALLNYEGTNKFVYMFRSSGAVWSFMWVQMNLECCQTRKLTGPLSMGGMFISTHMVHSMAMGHSMCVPSEL